MNKPPLSPAILFLRRVMAQRGPKHERFRWHHILSALHHVGQDPSIEAERTLRKIVGFKGTIPLRPDSSLPHSMSPESMFQSLALQSLAQRKSPGHRALVARVARTTHFDLVAAIARSTLRKKGR